MYKKRVYRKGHPLANKIGEIRKSRYVLYEKLKGNAGNCNWCGIKLTWETLCADHLDSDMTNDVESNLVGSCRGCNANRDDGTGFGRIKLKNCLECKNRFKPRIKTTRFCSNKCASMNRPKRGTKSKHGTRTRYVWGCRCIKCKNENLRYSRERYKINK